MSNVTIYTCDLCGAKQDSNDQFWRIGIGYKHYPRTGELKVHTSLSADACRSCMEKIKILPGNWSKPEPKSEPYPEPTVAERLQLLIEELVAGVLP